MSHLSLAHEALAKYGRSLPPHNLRRRETDCIVYRFPDGSELVIVDRPYITPVAVAHASSQLTMFPILTGETL